MLKSPNNVQIEANQGRGEIIVRGYMKVDRARVENLSAPVLESMQRQLEELRMQIAAGYTVAPSPTPSPVPAAPSPVPAVVVPAPAPTVVVPAVVPASTSQVFKLQEQIATLNARLNTLQDRMQVMENRSLSYSSSSSSAGGVGVGRMVSDVANSLAAGVAAEVSQAATEQIHKAAMKLEDMVSPGALYNLRKVSKENIKFAW